VIYYYSDDDESKSLRKILCLCCYCDNLLSYYL